ncbi:MerR family transcriptional regulator [Shimia sp. FJ5]|uniref:MerR family transcriptional regulator n=1 Tax=Shimia sp. FJ5 TaxID=3079054 RepID=UPI002638D8DC|nr:MerR family transcriptional regulator [Shimia sp. FJ5]MDV4144051.1 MerR family transcriptional regulator [Shimia sp. FJ5]
MGKSPDAFRTISEVADWLDTQAHVLRFWESKFTQVKPVKRAGGRRYYRPADMLLLGGIKKLLHDDGMTIKGAQKLLREKGTKYVAGLSQPLDGEDDATPESDIGLTEVAPAPLEEERGTVLSFERRDEPEEEPPAQVEEAASEPAAPAEDLAPEPTEAPQDAAPVEATPEDDDLPEKDIPAFVQRMTPKPATDDATASPAAPEPETETAAAASMEDEIAEEDAEDDQPRASEPGPSLLADIATMTGIVAENRADAAAQLDRLTALCARIEAAENA